MTPAITGISGDTLSLMNAEQLSPFATYEDSITVSLSDLPDAARFAETITFNGLPNSTLDVASGGSDTWSTVNGFKSGDEGTMWDVMRR